MSYLFLACKAKNKYDNKIIKHLIQKRYKYSIEQCGKYYELVKNQLELGE
jgi:hypothetical protein